MDFRAFFSSFIGFLKDICYYKTKNLVISKTCRNFAVANRKNDGALAQVVEQWTENPCVPGSNPGGTTQENRKQLSFNCLRFFYACRCPT